MTVQAIRGVVEAAIQRASQATGVDFSFLLGTAKRESGYNPSAHAKTSSAAGLFQFVDQTWLATLKKHGAKYGYARYADLIGQGSDGRYYVSGSAGPRSSMSTSMCSCSCRSLCRAEAYWTKPWFEGWLAGTGASAPWVRFA